MEGKIPLVQLPPLRPILLWMEPMVADLKEDEFWKWLNEFYEVGPTPEQIKELRVLINPENIPDRNLEPNWNLWITLDKIWENHYDAWYDRGYRPLTTGGWYWRFADEDYRRRQKEYELKLKTNTDKDI